MEQKYKKTYVCPFIMVTEFCAGHLLVVSGDSDGYEDKPGQDDVIYEQRRGGWSCDNWTEIEE